MPSVLSVLPPMPYILPLSLRFFPLCYILPTMAGFYTSRILMGHYAFSSFSSSPYALYLATMPSVLPPMLYLAHYGWLLYQQNTHGPLCLQFFPLCLISCHYAFGSSPYAISCPLWLASTPAEHSPSLGPPFMMIIWSCPYAFNKSWGEP